MTNTITKQIPVKNMQQQAQVWSRISDYYLAQDSIESAFIGYIIADWLYDTNFYMNTNKTTINQDELNELRLWATQDPNESNEQVVSDYVQWLTDSMLHPDAILNEIKQVYHANKAEIKHQLGNHPVSYINEFSDDYYLSCFGNLF